jgi:hypothetical protein
MRYLLLISSDETVYNTDDGTTTMSDDYAAFMAEMGARGLIQGGERLRPTSDATSVAVRDGEVLTTDGPFAETKEQLGGYFLVDCADLDEAIEVASKIPTAKVGTIEVRPVWELEM